MKSLFQIALLIGLCLFLVCPTQIKSADLGALPGSGTAEDPYQIDSSKDFEQFREAVNQGNQTAATATYRLTQDIILADDSCVSVGTSTQDKAFSGVFDGEGHSISNLYQNGTLGCVPTVGGLFGQVTGTIKNLTVQGKIELELRSPPRVQLYLGGIAGWVNGGTISYCRSDVDITLTDRYDRMKYVGGVCGKLDGTAVHCFFGSVLSIQNLNKRYQNSYVGGVGVCQGEQPDAVVSHCGVQRNPTQEDIGLAHVATFPSAEEKTEAELLSILNGEREDEDPLWIMDDDTPILQCKAQPNPPKESITVTADREEYTYGDQVTLTAELEHPYPAQDVTFWNGETILGSAELKNGTAVLILPRLVAGIYDEITAGYPDSPVGVCSPFTVKRAVPDPSQITFHLPESGCVYDGTPKIAETEVPHGMGKVTLYYSVIDGEEPTDSPPISAGTYTVTAEVAPSRNYAGFENLTVGTITINPAEIAVNINKTVIDSRPYVEGDCSLLSNHIHPAFANLPSGQTLNNADYLIENARFEDDCVGEKVITFTVHLKNKNYCFAQGERQVRATAWGTITPHAGCIKLHRYEDQIYDGLPVPNPSDWTKSGDGEVTFRWFCLDGTELTQPPSDVGTYEVQPILLDGTLYGGAVGEKVEFAISYLTCGTAQLKGVYTPLGKRRWYHTVTLIPPEGYSIAGENTEWQDALYPPIKDGNNLGISYRLRNEMGQISVLKTTAPFGVDNTPPTISLNSDSATEKTVTISCRTEDKDSGTAILYAICCPINDPAPSVETIQSEGEILKEGRMTFSGLQAATQYKIYVIAQDRARNMSGVYAIDSKTIPAIPDVSEVSVHYAAESLTFPKEWQGNTQADFTGRSVQSGDDIGTLAGESVFLRVAGNQGFAPSDVVEFRVPTRPDNIAPPTLDYKAETLLLDEAGRISFDHQGETISIEHHMGETVRYWRVATNQAFASLPAEFKIPVRPKAPDPIEMTTCTKNSIAIHMPEGCEVRLQDRSWQTEPTFYNLTPGHSYRIETRYQATPCAFASEVTTSSVTTKQETPVVIGKLTAVYGRTLEELEDEIQTISAEVGGIAIAGTWQWATSVDQSIQPQVGELTAYEAIFTPQRSDCCSVGVSILPQIEPAESTIAITEAPDKVYDGMLYGETVKTTVTGSSGDVHFAYFTDETCKHPATPSCVGTYWVRASVESDRNHTKAVSKPVPVTIEPILLYPVADVSQERTRTYDGKTELSRVRIELEAAEGYQMLDWQSPKATGRAESVTPNAGERKLCIFDIKLTDDWSSGYALTTDSIYEETDIDLIRPCPVTLKWHDPASTMYDGTAKIVTADAETSDDMEPVTVTLTGGEATYVGSYTAEAVALSSNNYALPQDGTTKHHFSISAAAQTFIPPERRIPAGTKYALPAKTNEGGVISYSLEGTERKDVTIEDGILQDGTAGASISLNAIAIPLDLNGDGTPEYRQMEQTFPVTFIKGEALPFEDVTLYKTYGDDAFYLPLTYAGSCDHVQYTVTDGWDIIKLEGRRITVRGAGTVTLIAVGSAPNYEDATAVVTINIEPRDISHVTCSEISDSYPYTGKVIRPTVQLLDGANLETRDYAITYGENKTVATGGTITITGKGRYRGSKSTDFTITPAQLQGTPRFQCLGTTFDTVKADYSGMTWMEERAVCGNLTWYTTNGREMNATDSIQSGAEYRWRFMPYNVNYNPLIGQIQLLGQGTHEDSGGGSSNQTKSSERETSMKGEKDETLIELFVQLHETKNGEKKGTISEDQIEPVFDQINQPSTKKVEVVLNATESPSNSPVRVCIPTEIGTLICQGNNQSRLTIETQNATIKLSQTALAGRDRDTPLVVTTKQISPQYNAETTSKSAAKRPTKTDDAMQQLADEGNSVVSVTVETDGKLWRWEHRVGLEIPMGKMQSIKDPVVLAKTKTGFQLLPVIVEAGQARFETQEGGVFAVIERTDVPVELLFSDIAKDDWNRDAVGYVVKNGMMAGTSKQCFAPKQTTTRAMLVTMLYRAAGSPETTGAVFADTKDSWCEKAVAWAAEHEIVNGFDADSFAPAAVLTREQMVTILYRYTQQNSHTMVVEKDCLRKYNDQSAIHEYAQNAMAWAVQKGILTGTTSETLSPNGYAKRDQTAVILMRYMEQQ